MRSLMQQETFHHLRNSGGWIGKLILFLICGIAYMWIFWQVAKLACGEFEEPERPPWPESFNMREWERP